jgi:hypothetical protein
MAPQKGENFMWLSALLVLQNALMAKVPIQ